MECVYPECRGSLRTGVRCGFCLLCRLPVAACQHCGEWNRSFAVFCRTCGQAMEGWHSTDPIDPAVLQTEPRRSALPQPLTTAPQSAAGLVWAMGEAGELYRVNPYASSEQQVEVHDRFWAGAQPHSFCVRTLHAGAELTTASGAPHPGEPCAVIATPERIVAAGLFSRHKRTLFPAPGEQFLVTSRERYNFVEGDGSQVFCIARNGSQTSLLLADLQTDSVVRLPIPGNDLAVCGPVLLTVDDAVHLVLWTASALWTWTAGALTSVDLPDGVRLKTGAVDESGLRLPLGRSPAIVAGDHLFLPGTQFGASALLRLTRLPSRWSLSVVPISQPGTLTANTAGQPLLASTGKLLVCTAQSFRTLLEDGQMAPRFPAFAQDGLSVFFCEADYGGRKQWIKASFEGSERGVTWSLPAGSQLRSCGGFWPMGPALATECILGGLSLQTEFVSWCD